MQRIEEYSGRGRQSLHELAAAEIDTLLGNRRAVQARIRRRRDGYKPSASANAGVEVPQIARLEPECHNFLYEAKNFIRDLLQVVNHLYGTTFEEASEFSRAAKKKGSQSLVEFAEKTFGPGDGKTKMFKEAVPTIEALISMRNAVEHPDGYSGKLVIANFTLEWR